MTGGRQLPVRMPVYHGSDVVHSGREMVGPVALALPQRGAARDRFFAATMGAAGAIGLVASLGSLAGGVEVVYRAA